MQIEAYCHYQTIDLSDEQRYFRRVNLSLQNHMVASVS